MNINQTSYMAQAAQASYAELNSGSGGTGLRDQLLLQINKGVGRRRSRRASAGLLSTC